MRTEKRLVVRGWRFGWLVPASPVTAGEHTAAHGAISPSQLTMNVMDARKIRRRGAGACVAFTLVAVAAGCGLTSPPAGDGVAASTGGLPGQEEDDISGSGGLTGLGIVPDATGGSEGSECDACTPAGPVCVAPNVQVICVSEFDPCMHEPGTFRSGISRSACDEGSDSAQGGAASDTAGSVAGGAGEATGGQLCPRVEELVFGLRGSRACGACTLDPVCPSGPAVEDANYPGQCCYLVHMVCNTC